MSVRHVAHGARKNYRRTRPRRTPRAAFCDWGGCRSQLAVARGPRGSVPNNGCPVGALRLLVGAGSSPGLGGPRGKKNYSLSFVGSTDEASPVSFIMCGIVRTDTDGAADRIEAAASFGTCGGMGKASGGRRAGGIVLTRVYNGGSGAGSC